MGIHIAAGSGSGSAGVANRGLGNEGLYLKSGMEYEGYFFAASKSAGPVTLEARLETTDGTATLCPISPCFIPTCPFIRCVLPYKYRKILGMLLKLMSHAK